MSRSGTGLRIEQLRKEVSRKASMANKRLIRLETNKLTELSAYRQWVDYGGGVKFSVKGKDYNQLQSELARVNKFINNKTSLVRSANKILKNIASDTKIDYQSVKELPEKLSGFFELASKVEQYLRHVEGSASAIGYQKIWEVINEYVETEREDLQSGDIDGMVKQVSDMLKYEETSLSSKDTEDLWNLVARGTNWKG